MNKYLQMKNKNAIFYIISISLLSILLIVNCIFLFFTNKSTEEIYNENISKVVEIKVSDDEETWGYATGCFIDANGTILTNKHVVYNSTNVSNYNYVFVRLSSSDDWISAIIQEVSLDNDLALIKIDYKSDDYFSFEEDITNGKTIYTIGNPNGFGLSFTTGVVSSSLRNVIYDGETLSAIQTSFVINEGNSGGPVFTSEGKLVGLISFRLKDRNGDVIQGVSFAVPSKQIKEFIYK